MEQNDKNVLIDYRKNRCRYEELEAIIVERINKIIADNDFFILEIQHRVKELESLEGKIKRKPGHYNKLSDITDLLGIRVICYFSDTVDEIAEELERVFDIDQDNSVDKRALMNATQFGYLSLHYICSLKKENIETGKEYLGDIRFEVQVRTVLQHTWAEIEHDLGYKSDYGIPRSIRREFSRVASLLEVADNQFVSLRNSTWEYSESIRNKIVNDDADDVLLDKVSLEEYIRHNHSLNALFMEITNETGSELERISAENYIEKLSFLGIETIGDMSRLLEHNIVAAKKCIIEKIRDFELDIFSSNMVLRYLCDIEVVRLKYSEDKVRDYVQLTYKEPKRIENHVNAIIKAMNVDTD